MNWQPINTLPPNQVAILYQPKGEFRDAGMIIGSIRKESYGLIVDPSMIGGYEMECDVTDPTHWMPLPEAPR